MDSHQENSSNIKHNYSEASLNDLVKRLSRIEGHIRGVKNMVEASRPCPDVLVQIAAVRGAVQQVGRIILHEYLKESVARTTQEGDIKTEIEALKTVLDRFFP
ncbi:MAG: metal-sensitive transcriptional regulator [Nostoc sp. ChiSLP01]|uniref:metal-sensitive transcriptional regulator n=1 Tax=unclassified Nostoc TaxID=2593658 RepID=UPI002AD8CFCD|nr:metal-sensitive transcriptional regulator [Nostoc sp. CmiSLP01]MDZ8288655.1 metal-sensitive transcriptional regulator [Nostoc sp. ChiSLP01]